MADPSTIQAVSWAVTIALAFVGYIVTYLNSVRLANRKARVKFISDQIQYLYGPLYSATHTTQVA